MNTGLHYSVPAVWEIGAVDGLAEMSARHGSEEVYVYGCLPNMAPSGRPNDYAAVSRDRAQRVFRHAENRGLRTEYLLNGSFAGFQRAVPKEYMRWVAEELRPDLIKVSDYGIARRLVREFGIPRLEISTIAGLRTGEDVSNWVRRLGESGRVLSVNLHHDACRMPDTVLRGMVERLQDCGIEPSVLVTESCYFGCPVRSEHYAFFGAIAGQAWEEGFCDPYQIRCVQRRLENPASLLDLAGFLPPSYLKEFSERSGIRSFKISGRSMEQSWVLRTAEAYFAGLNTENVFDGIVFTLPFRRELGMELGDLFFLDSEAYSAVFSRLQRILSPSTQREFLVREAARLFADGALKINDPGSCYVLRQGKVYLAREGAYLRLLRCRSGAMERHVVRCQERHPEPAAVY